MINIKQKFLEQFGQTLKSSEPYILEFWTRHVNFTTADKHVTLVFNYETNLWEKW